MHTLRITEETASTEAQALLVESNTTSDESHSSIAPSAVVSDKVKRTQLTWTETWCVLVLALVLGAPAILWWWNTLPHLSPEWIKPAFKALVPILLGNLAAASARAIVLLFSPLVRMWVTEQKRR